MITNDENTALAHQVKNYTRMIEAYVDVQKDTMAARNLFPVRNVGADTAIDVVTTYNDAVTGGEAQVVAKGSAPLTSGMKASSTNHDMYQIADAFMINAKDLKLDPQSKKRSLDLLMRHIHRTEDNLALNGSSKYGITGTVDAAQANTNGKIVATGASGSDINNNGSWVGETGTDIYDDINTGIGKMDSDFKPAMLVGNRTDLNYLTRMDSERRPYADSIATLFGKKNEKDRSWMFETSQITAGKVYIMPKDMMAGEFVVSENPRVVPYEKSAGENFRIEVLSWSSIEIHDNQAFVEISTG